MLALGVPAEQVAGEIAAFGALRDLGDGQPTGTVRQVTGHDPKSFAAYAAEAAARGAWRS